MDLERVQVRVHRLRRFHTGDAEKFRLGKESLADWGSHACGMSETIDLIQDIDSNDFHSMQDFYYFEKKNEN